MSSRPPQLDDFCRVCLLQRPSLLPLATQCAAVMVPEMLYKITGMMINLQEPLPRVICERCLLKLELTYNIAEEFRKQEETLRRFWWRGGLVEQLVEYQEKEGTERTFYSEEVLERLVGERMEPSPTFVEPLPTVKAEPVDVNAFSIEMVPDETDDSFAIIDAGPEMALELVDLRTTGVLPAEVEEQLLEEQVLNDSFDQSTTFSEDMLPSQVDVEMGGFDLDREEEPDDFHDCDDDGDEDFHPNKAKNSSNKSLSLTLPEDTLDCPDCNKTCPTRRSLIRHYRRHMIKAKGRFHCKECNWNFASSGEFRVHEISHLNDQNFRIRPRYVCRYCRKEFPWQSRLERHERLHEKRQDPVLEEPLEEAEQQEIEPGSSKAASENPQQESNKSRYFKCKYCAKVFVWQTRLKNHEALHEKKRAAGISDSDPWVYRKTLEKKKTQPERPIIDDEDSNESGTVEKGSAYIECKYCQKPFQLESRLKQHEKAHEKKIAERAEKPRPDAPHKCPECPRTFTVVWKMEMHAQRHVTVKQGIFQCKTCDHSFATSVELRRHERMHQRKPEWRNADESKIPAPILILKSGRTFFKCRECGKLYDSRSNYFQHGQTHVAVNSGTFQCPDCGKRYGQRSTLRMHQRQKHNAFVKTEADEAEEEGEREGLMRHCEECDISFSTKKHYADHLKGHASGGNPPEGFIVQEIPEPVAATQKPTAPILKQELTIEDSQLQDASTVTTEASSMVVIPMEEPSGSGTTAKPINTFICNECGTMLSSHRTYLQHLKYHENIRTGRFKCEVCQRCHARKSQLLRHRKVKHGLDDPDEAKTNSQECDECNRMIKIKLMKTHMRCHESIRLRLFVCEVCDKAFGCTSHLKEHVIGRTCEKLPATEHKGKYECDECGKKYDNAGSMDSHMRMHRNMREGRYRCEICQEVFAGRRLLEDHTVKIHKQIPS